jgi:hypothetical protein
MTRSSNDKIKWTNWTFPSDPIPKGAIAGGNINADGSYYQYKIIANLDYHHTTEFRIDSVKAILNYPIATINDDDNIRTGKVLTNTIEIKGNIALVNLVHDGKFIVYDISGRQTKCLNLKAGNYQIPVADAQGIYFLNLITNYSTEKKKAVVTK